MRKISCDQYEFDPPDSEQQLQLAIASPSRHCPDLRSLLATCDASSDHGTPIPPAWPRWRELTDHLQRFAALDLPHPSQLRETVFLRDDWDDVEIGIAFGTVMIWYHWSTTA